MNNEIAERYDAQRLVHRDREKVVGSPFSSYSIESRLGH
jgi:hypothetical protein